MHRSIQSTFQSYIIGLNNLHALNYRTVIELCLYQFQNCHLSASTITQQQWAHPATHPVLAVCQTCYIPSLPLHQHLRLMQKSRVRWQDHTARSRPMYCRTSCHPAKAATIPWEDWSHLYLCWVPCTQPGTSSTSSATHRLPMSKYCLLYLLPNGFKWSQGQWEAAVELLGWRHSAETWPGEGKVSSLINNSLKLKAELVVQLWFQLPCCLC